MKLRLGKKGMEVEMLVKVALVVAVILVAIFIAYSSFKKGGGEGGLLSNLFSTMRGGG